MSWWFLLCALAICLLASSSSSSAAVKQERKLHRLVGGHLRIHNEDSNDDAELLTALSSGSKNKKSQKGDDEEKKTLSQQVADGKYGLIQKELFAKPSKRPGVLSYDNNPEVPKDNINNLGGLTKNEIWLAENHLLVLKGGTYPPHDTQTAATPWPAIDDFKAPRRPVKIPAHPKIPPPFPVQLRDDGPLQILGTNSSRTLNGTFNEGAYAVPPPEGFEPGTGPFFLPPDGPYPANATAGQAPIPIPAYPSGDYLPGAPFPPYNLNGTLPPFFASLPPGAAILPPPSNQTDPFDEDDPSIYYPPPYSFYYQKDNASAVPAGPLVPGIILPPPPNFFAPLEETTTTRKPSRMRMKTTTTPAPQIHPTTTSIPPTSVLNEKTTRKPIRILPVHIPSEINNELKPIVTTAPPKVITIVPIRQPPRTSPPTRPPSVTILKPVKPPQNIYVYNNNNNNEVPPPKQQQYAVYGPPSRLKTFISTTQVPLRVYYSTANDIETNSITQPPEKYHIGISNKRQKTTTKAPTQYYFYEEQDDSTTKRPYFDLPKEYYVPAKPSNQQTSQPPPQKYIYVTSRPYKTQRPQRYRFVQTPKTDTFSIHIARLQKQIAQYYTTPRPNNNYRAVQHPPKPVYQFSFEAANYRPPPRPQQQQQQQQDENDKFRPLPKYSVQIQPAIEIIPTERPQQNYYPSSSERPAQSNYYNTPRPDYDYDDNVQENNKVTPRPVSQYSYEATPNPVYQGFYTKPDESFFDDNTKHYFTTFGKKLPTTPLPPRKQNQPQQYHQETQQPQQQYQQQPQQQYQQQQQKPQSLEGDTDVNYLHPRPTINPDSEFVPINPNRQRVNNNNNYPQVVNYSPTRPAQYAQESRHKNREIVKASAVNVQTSEGQPAGSFISYQLPGDDGAHFYFLTPQLAQSRDQGAGYYYSQPNVARIRRNKER